MPALIDITGQVFGRLTVISRSQGKNTRYLCKCICGTETIVQSGNLRTGHTQSCGCLNRESTVERETEHGLSKTKVHRTWCAIRGRCSNPSNKRFPYYGGRGIKVCKRWMVFENFLADMGIPEQWQSIDRIDNNGDYEPGNCRWVDHKTQCRNRRNNVIIEHDGEKLHLCDFAKRLNTHPSTLHNRIKKLGVAEAIRGFSASKLS